MKTSKSASSFTGTSHPHAVQGTPPNHPNKKLTAFAFKGTSRRGDLGEAFRKAKEAFQAARAGTAKLGEVSVTISVPLR
jgi:hypothetical protein